MSIEDRIKEWLQYEPRKKQLPKYNYCLTFETLYNRLKVQLPRFLIKDKKILDLGCCIPFNEPWCMENGAVLYHGVEILRDIAQKGKQLVGKNNEVFHDSIENFVYSADLDRYDLIIAQSSLNSSPNLPELLKKLFSTKKTIIFEFTKNSKHQDDPLIAISTSGVNFNEDGNDVYEIQKWFPNIESLDIFCKINNYEMDIRPNKIMSLKMPDWSKYKFCVWANPNKSEKIYPLMKDYEWRFDKKIATIFDSHAPKHIPDYEYVINSIPKIIQNYVNHNDKILDIGCATGKTIKTLYYNGYTNLVGTDSSLDMLDACPKNLAQYFNVDTIPSDRYKCILANWVLHFNKNKTELLRQIHTHLDDDGICVLTEKTLQTDRNLYHAWKQQQGVTKKEISDKENSLKGVMHCDSVDWYENTFKEIGFSFSLFNNKLGFHTWILKKIK